MLIKTHKNRLLVENDKQNNSSVREESGIYGFFQSLCGPGALLVGENNLMGTSASSLATTPFLRFSSHSTERFQYINFVYFLDTWFRLSEGEIQRKYLPALVFFMY